MLKEIKIIGTEFVCSFFFLSFLSEKDFFKIPLGAKGFLVLQVLLNNLENKVYQDNVPDSMTSNIFFY